MRMPDGVLPINPGEYGRMTAGPSPVWFVRLPVPGFPIANLAGYVVSEHADGSITVEEMIVMILDDGRRWHGYLVEGEWNTLAESVLRVPRRARKAE